MIVDWSEAAVEINVLRRRRDVFLMHSQYGDALLLTNRIVALEQKLVDWLTHDMKMGTPP